MAEWIDVSSNNGEDIRRWLPLCDGVIVKATQGSSYVNPYHDSQVAQARQAGKRVGHYHWAEPWLHSPHQEADHFHQFAKIQPDDVLAYDVEDRRQPAGDISPWVQEALRYTEASTGHTPLVYSFASYLTDHFPSVDRRFPLWLAAYQITAPKPPPGYAEYALWQYTSNPLDRSRGDVAGVPAPVPTPAPQGEANEMYIVQLKDHPHTFVTDGETQRWHHDQADHDRTVWHIAANHGDPKVYVETVDECKVRYLTGDIDPPLLDLGFKPVASGGGTGSVDAIAKAVADVLAGRLAS